MTVWTAREEEEFPEEVREHEVERGGAVVARLDHRLEDGRPPEKQLLVHHQMHSCRQHTGQRSHEPELLASNDPPVVAGESAVAERAFFLKRGRHSSGACRR